MRKKAGVFALALVFLIAGAPLSAQPAQPTGSVDGATNPEKIPDVVAFRLFVGALDTKPSDSLSSSAQPSVGQLAKLRPLALGASDTGILLEAVRTWHGNMAAASAPATSRDLDAVAQGLMSSLQQQMSAAGFASLMAHVRAEKKNMKIVFVPNMDKHNH